MIQNYLKTAFRIFIRNKTFTAINVLGLSIGISASLIIFLIAHYEFSYDTSVPNADRVYRVVMNLKFNGDESHSAAVPGPLSQVLPQETTGLELTVPVMQFQGDATAKVSIQRDKTAEPLVLKKQTGIVFTNPQYFSLLPHQWLAGSPVSALKNPFTVVLTESRARQYFPTANLPDMLGKEIKYNEDFTATISGIVQDLNNTTSFEAVEFISFATIAQTHLQNNFMMQVWNDWMAYSQVYVKLAPHTKAANVEHQLALLLNKYNKDANKDKANTIRFYLQPLSDLHFNKEYVGFNQRVVPKSVLYGLFAVAGFLLLLACINFINLTTANAARRAKEIGIRKTMGSSRKQLIMQFLGETFLLTLLAALVSFCLAPALLKLFADFIPAGLQGQSLRQPYVFLFLFLLTVLVSFLSGLYPAFVLSGYQPIKVLKAQAFIRGNETKQVWIRKTLTISQFAIAQVFVVATLIVSKQINYALHTELGFNKEGIITFFLPRDTVTTHRQQLLNEINAIPAVELASTGFLAPMEDGPAFTHIAYSPKPEIKEPVQIRWGDPNYIHVFKIKLIAGRNILASDSIQEFLINATYAKLLGFQNPEDAIGQHLRFGEKKLPIVGVMQDFHEQSMHAAITPLVLGGNNGDIFHVRLKPNMAGNNNWQQAIRKIQKAYHQIYPDEDFDYKFVDEAVAHFYQTEQRTAHLLSWATGLSILISCLGLVGLVMYTVHSRTKEIGIRKILGASVNSIAAMLSQDFLKLVVLANILAWPLVWYGMYRWLQNFVYRIEISWYLFVLAGVAALLIALITVSFQAIKAAVANPVEALRSE
ncbi:ABC transporter permease [Adhaeribacter pallidiroseus]|uniref:Putative ABC transporter permease YknZ n=1 Tax=Adhaeribacter pallidiroseus TaxID=2072847 RepID=A0A369QTG8_9BACT|nr:ABC transporter permease [Adhaeribacter pallidiroseus]RDC65458.1 putative ABC transporter permease YknZ [Adhaeribacter pallidiroseus]